MLPGLPLDVFVSGAAPGALSPAAVDISLKAIEDADRRRLGEFCGLHFRRLSARLAPKERDGIRRAASGISELWDDGCLDRPAKAEILRLMIDRAAATAVDGSERVEIEIHLRGGTRTRAKVRRPVRDAGQPGCCGELCARVRALKDEGLNRAGITAVLNEEGLQPPRKSLFSKGMAASLVDRVGAYQ